MMVDYTAQRVAEMQSDLELSQRRVIELEHHVSIITAERDQLRSEIVSARASRDDFMTKATKMRTILEHTSIGLVQGLNTMRADEEREKITRRAQQEHDLGVNNGTGPRFLSRRDTVEFAERTGSGSLGGGAEAAPRQRDIPPPRVETEQRPQMLEPPKTPHTASADRTQEFREFRKTPLEHAPVTMRSDAIPIRSMTGRLPPVSDDHPYANDPRMPRVDPLQPGPHDETRSQRDERNLRELARQIGADEPARPYIRDARNPNDHIS